MKQPPRRLCKRCNAREGGIRIYGSRRGSTEGCDPDPFRPLCSSVQSTICLCISAMSRGIPRRCANSKTHIDGEPVDRSCDKSYRVPGTMNFAPLACCDVPGSNYSEPCSAPPEGYPSDRKARTRRSDHHLKQDPGNYFLRV